MAGLPLPPTIDLLLFRYLNLIDCYGELTSRLAKVHSAMHVDLAQANFVSPHGERFGPERFPTVMEARWRVDVTVASDGRPVRRKADNDDPIDFAAARKGEKDNGSLESHNSSKFDGLSITELASNVRLGEIIPRFRVIDWHSEEKDFPAVGKISLDSRKEDATAATARTGPDVDRLENEENDCSYEKVDPSLERPADSDGDHNATIKPASSRKRPSPHDPLFWISALPGQALRAAQSQADISVTDIIPRLASVAAEMRAVEIEIQRLRKRRAKALKDRSRRDSQSRELGVNAAQVTSL